MFDPNLENRLILPDIAQRMVDYVSIQIDIDERKVKAASLVAQDIDVKRIIKQVNVERCIDQDDSTSEADKNLKALLIAPLCYYTYARCLTMFPGTFTDGGYHIDPESTDKNVSKSVGNEMKSIGDVHMTSVVDFLEAEDENTVAEPEKMSSKIRVFGGQERRASN